MPYTVGLTGGIGSGKSTVADRFAREGIAIVDADVVAHRLTAPGGDAIDAIRVAFGPGVLAADGSMDRAAMRTRVFTDPAERLRLEAILHPLIRIACDAERDAARSPYVLLVVPLLFESGPRAGRAQRTLLVTCDESVQIARVMRRSALTESEVKAIIATQMPQHEKLRLADDFIDNSGPPDALDEPVRRLHRRYVEAAERHAGR